jgi:hypothetical protein
MIGVACGAWVSGFAFEFGVYYSTDSTDEVDGVSGFRVRLSGYSLGFRDSDFGFLVSGRG